MIEKIHETPSIYRAQVPLPNNPLGYLNCLVFPEAERPLIVDTGFNRPECLEAFQAGMDELGIDLAKADVLITHVHGDHSGLAYKLHQKGATIYMNAIDYEYFVESKTGQVWPAMEELFRHEGFPEAELEAQKDANQARLYSAEDIFPAVLIHDGDKLSLGGQELLAIWTPGHTKGHTCFYLAEHEMMILGDHVLFDITPNITCWKGAPDSLGDYLDSLDKISRYPVRTPYPGHRKNEMGMVERIEQIKEHHARRLASTREIIAGEPGLNAYEIAGRLTWSMRGKSWSEAAVGQKWFAMGETLSHLDYLLLRGEIAREERGNARVYLPV